MNDPQAQKRSTYDDSTYPEKLDLYSQNIWNSNGTSTSTRLSSSSRPYPSTANNTLYPRAEKHPWSDHRSSHPYSFANTSSHQVDGNASSSSIASLTYSSESESDLTSIATSKARPIFMSTSTSTSTSTSMSIPPLPISLDHSWRSDSPRRNVNGKEREVIWDVSHTPNGLDALGLSVHDEDESSYTGGSKARSYSDHDYTRNIQRAKDLDKKKDRDKEHGPLSVDVLARIVDTSNGRDKVLKCIQYSLRTYLYLLTIVAKIRPLSPWFRSNAKRMKLAISGLSLTRKCLLLFNPLHPLSDLLSPDPMSARTLIGHLIDLVSALSDDIACFSRLGFINKRVGGKADDWANRFWLLTTLMGLYKLHFKTIPKLSNSPSSYSSNTTSLSLEKRRAELNDAKWTNRKLLADLIFVGYDVLELNFGIIEEPMKCATGLFAALISTFKLYNKHWEASIGKG